MKFLKNNTFIYLLFSILISCIPQEEDIKEELVCESGSVFDQKSRACQSTAAKIEADRIEAENEVKRLTNTIPVIGTNKSFSFSEGQYSSFSFTLNPGFDADSDSLEYVITQQPDFGIIVCVGVNCNATVDLDYFGNTEMKYRVNDGLNDSLNEGQIDFIVNSINDRPQIYMNTDISSTTFTEDTTYSLTFKVDEGGGSSEDAQKSRIKFSFDSNIVDSNSLTLKDSDNNTFEKKNSGYYNLDSDNEDVNLKTFILSFNSTLNSVSDVNITFTLEDDGGVDDSSSTSYVMDIQEVNDEPSFNNFSITSLNVNENDSSGTSIMTLTINSGAFNESSSIDVLNSSSPSINLSHSNSSNLTNSSGDSIFYLEKLTNSISNGEQEIKIVYGNNDLDVNTSIFTSEKLTLSISDDTHSKNITFDVNILSQNDSPDLSHNYSSAQSIVEDSTEVIYNFRFGPGGNKEDEKSQNLSIKINNFESELSNYLLSIAVKDSSSNLKCNITNADYCSISTIESDTTDNLSDYTLHLFPKSNVSNNNNMSLDIYLKDSEGAESNNNAFEFKILNTNDVPIAKVLSPRLQTLTHESSYNITVATSQKINLLLHFDEGDESLDTTDTSITEEDSDQLILYYDSSDNLKFPNSNLSLDIYNFDSTPTLTKNYFIDASDSKIELDNSSVRGGNDENDLKNRYVWLDFTPNNSINSTTENLTFRLTDTTDTLRFSFSITTLPVAIKQGKWSEIKVIGPKTNELGEYLSNSNSKLSVSLKWEQFEIIQPLDQSYSIVGYNVYRSTSEKFDYRNPINSSIVTTSELTIEDCSIYNNQNTNITTCHPSGSLANDPLEMSKKYFYKIRPVINNGTGDIEVDVDIDEYPTSILSIVTPSKNQVFVHRWMANLKTCGELSSTTDHTNNYRCPYTGPANNNSFFDFNRNLIVDQFEMSCNYSRSECAGQQCIDNSDILIDPDNINGENIFFYNRQSGDCKHFASSVWNSINSAEITDLSIMKRPYSPPIVNISKQDANNICIVDSFTFSNKPKINPYLDSSDNISSTGRLPSRVEHFVFSKWSTDSNVNSSTYEQGAINSTTSACNTYKDKDVEYIDNFAFNENTVFADTIPGMFSNTIRSLVTGSFFTANCSSLYGISDTIGNVSEWIKDDIEVSYNHDNNASNIELTIKQYTNSSDTFTNANIIFNNSFDIVSKTLSQIDGNKYFLLFGLKADDASDTAVDYSSVSNLINSDIIELSFVTPDSSDTDSPIDISVGGGYNTNSTNTSSEAGRFYSNFKTKDSSDTSTGFRCVVPIDID